MGSMAAPFPTSHLLYGAPKRGPAYTERGPRRREGGQAGAGLGRRVSQRAGGSRTLPGQPQRQKVAVWELREREAP